ncbi:hypothetical protein [Bdellovibrio sp. HCB337]|uniref:hypothetical protein n=1 Tax=Bdellovibrio sp. HCB337 TaxID=3394358 RepID=UPI0039A4470B
MKRDFDYVGFEVPERTRFTMRRFLDKLQNATPDSYVNATVTKEDENYVLKVAVKFVDGQFAAETQGQDLMDVLNQASETLRLQVKVWRESRFGGHEGRQSLRSHRPVGYEKNIHPP